MKQFDDEELRKAAGGILEVIAHLQEKGELPLAHTPAPDPN